MWRCSSRGGYEYDIFRLQTVTYREYLSIILLCTSRSAWRFYSEANGTLSYKKDCKKKTKKNASQILQGILKNVKI